MIITTVIHAAVCRSLGLRKPTGTSENDGEPSKRLGRTGQGPTGPTWAFFVAPLQVIEVCTRGFRSRFRGVLLQDLRLLEAFRSRNNPCNVEKKHLDFRA